MKNIYYLEGYTLPTYYNDVVKHFEETDSKYSELHTANYFWLFQPDLRKKATSFEKCTDVKITSLYRF